MAFTSIHPIGILVYKDAKDNFSSVKIAAKDPAVELTDEKLNTFVTGIQAKTDCVICRKERLWGQFDSALDGAGNKDDRALLNFQDEYGRVHRYILPGYSGATEQDNDGLKMTDAEATAVAALFSAFTGFTFTALRCAVVRTK